MYVNPGYDKKKYTTINFCNECVSYNSIFEVQYIIVVQIKK